MHGLRPNSNDYVFYVIYVRVQNVAIYMLKHYLYLEGNNLFMSNKKSAEQLESSDVMETVAKAVIEKQQKENSKDKEDKTRRYKYEVVIYEDDPLFKEQYEALTAVNSAIWVKHDKDIFTEDVFNEDGSIKYNAGDLKKAHYHFLLKFKNGIVISAVAKKVKVNKNQVQIIKNFNSALKYLIHFGQDEKYQYSMDDVSSNSDNLKTQFEELIINDTPESRRVLTIQEIIEDFDGYIDLGILGKVIIKMNYWGTFKSSFSYFFKLVDLHNAKFMAKKQGQKDLEYSVHSVLKGDFDD